MSDNTDDAKLTQLVETVRESRKYRAVSEDLIRAIGRKELATQRNLKEAVKTTKNKLHQVAGAYLDSKMPYADWLRSFSAWRKHSDETMFIATCLTIMERHASTRERQKILPEFYSTIFANLPPIHTVLDIACGLNPLTIPWMPLAPNATYYACDIYEDMIAFLNRFFDIEGIEGHASVRDVIQSPPPQVVDLALVLKVLPVLEQIEKTAPLNLLRSLQARHILVSFPTATLGGRSKPMTDYYAQHFLEMIEGEAFTVQRFEFATELCFLLAR